MCPLPEMWTVLVSPWGQGTPTLYLTSVVQSPSLSARGPLSISVALGQARRVETGLQTKSRPGLTVAPNIVVDCRQPSPFSIHIAYYQSIKHGAVANALDWDLAAADSIPTKTIAYLLKHFSLSIDKMIGLQKRYLNSLLDLC